MKNIASPICSAWFSLFSWAIALCLSGWGGEAAAATYYVNNSGSPACGNSAGRGTWAQPFCTISYALAQMAGGDTVLVQSGTYNENLYITGPAGSAGAPTVIAAYPGDTVTLMGNGVNTGRCKILNTAYLSVQGFAITNYNQGLFVDSSSTITISRCTIHHVGQEGLHVHLHSSFVTIDHCVVHDTRQWQYNGEGIYIGTGDAAPVDNTHHVTVRNTTIYNTPDEGIEFKIGTHHLVAEGNTIYNVNLGSDWSQNGNDVGAIEVNQAVGSVQHYDGDPQQVVRNNFIHDVKTAVRAGTGCLVYNNVIWSVSGYGIYVDNSSNDSYTRAIYHNTIDATPANAVFHAGGTQDVRNNLGPATAKNLPTQDGYYVDKAKADYHLVQGIAPIDAGDDLTAIVPEDRDGVNRQTGGAPDLGAYEYSPSGCINAFTIPGPAYPDRLFLIVGPGKIDFAVPAAGPAQLAILDISGRSVCILLDTWTGRGRHSVVWDRSGYPAGVCLFRLVTRGASLVQKGMIIR